MIEQNQPPPTYSVAYDALARAPGGDFGGYRARMNDDIGDAAEALVDGITPFNARHP